MPTPLEMEAGKVRDEMRSWLQRKGVDAKESDSLTDLWKMVCIYVDEADERSQKACAEVLRLEQEIESFGDVLKVELDRENI